MKTKLTVTIDEKLLPRAKEYARGRGVSLSEVIEATLRELSAGSGTDSSFANRWRGRFRPARKNERRYQLLAKKYL